LKSSACPFPPLNPGRFFWLPVDKKGASSEAP
jgi:hypothetical protein